MLKHLTLVIIFLSWGTFLSAQDDEPKVSQERLQANGTISDEKGNKLKEVTVQVFVKKDGEFKYEASGETRGNGQIETNFDLDQEYMLVFKKRGFIKKKIVFDTHIPRPREDYYLFEFTMIMTEKVPQEVGPELLDKPVVKVYFKSEKRDFAYDSLYLAQLKAELTRLRPDVKDKLKQALNSSASDDEISQLVQKAEAETKERTDKYNALINKADQSFGAQDYASARQAYQDAMALDEFSPYPKDKLAEIDKLLADVQNQQAIEARYQTAVTTGDKLLGEKKYEEAKTAYNDAVAAKPQEEYPKKKVDEINDVLYKDFIAKAEKALKAKQYNDAKYAYVQALTVKPVEQYPKDKIAELETIIAGLGKQEQYNEAITRANKALATAKADKNQVPGTYDEAKKLYADANTIKPDEKLPKDKIQEIETIVATLIGAEERNKQYNELIAEADKEYEAKNHVTARAKYNEAIKLKPAEKHPKQRMVEIDKILENLRNALVKNEKYQNEIKQADSYFDQKNYLAAKTGYKKALGYIPEEQYPKDRLAEIEKIINANKPDPATVRYQNTIANADKTFDGKQYAIAKSLYNAALRIKPEEQYPKDRITEIEKLEKEQQAEALNKRYADVIDRANKAFDNKQYTSSKTLFGNAAALKPEEQYPKDKITEIDNIIKQQLSDAGKKRFADLIERGDRAMEAKQYYNAKSLYTAAININPAEEYPKKRLDEVNALIQQLAAATAADIVARYNQTIFKADKFFKDKQYDDAGKNYREALLIKPGESYPQTMLDRISTLIASESDKPAIAIDKNMLIFERNAQDLSVRTDTDAKTKQLAQVKRLEKAKNNNLFAKYTTKNPLTSLYDEVDEHHAELKNKQNTK